MAAPRIAEQIGRVLGGRYRLVGPIGTGASAHVYLAEDVTLRRRVAVKILHPALASDESFLRRFRAEAQAVAGLRHPAIMSVYDWGEDADGPFLVLEHLAGGSLRDLLDQGERLSVAQAADVGLQVARALEHAHRRGLVHRDIKPANLIFDEEGRIVVADFGLARALAEASSTEPTGAVLGTARYSSPEQALGSTLDGRADVYALALVLIEAVTGQVPFTADTTIGTLMARVGRPLEIPEEMGALAPLLQAAGASELDDRIDAAALARALDELVPQLGRPEPLALAGRSTIDLRDGPDDLTQLPAPASRLFDADTLLGPEAKGSVSATALAVNGADPPKVVGLGLRRRFRRSVLVVLALLVIALVVGGGAYAYQQSQVPTFPVPALLGLTVEGARAEVADEGFRIEEIRRDYAEDREAGRILNVEPAPGKSLKQGSDVEVVVSAGPAPREVPNLANLDQAAAAAALQRAGFEMVAVPTPSEEVKVKGTVLGWAPRGEQPKFTKIEVKVSSGPPDRAVPSLGDRLYDVYVKALEALGLKANRQEAFSDTVPVGQIVDTVPPPGSPAAYESAVTVNVSKGPEKVAIPSLNGLSEAAAKARLEAAGLRLGDSFGPSGRPVFATSPTANTPVNKGTAIDVYTR